MKPKYPSCSPTWLVRLGIVLLCGAAMDCSAPPPTEEANEAVGKDAARPAAAPVESPKPAPTAKPARTEPATPERRRSSDTEQAPPPRASVPEPSPEAEAVPLRANVPVPDPEPEIVELEVPAGTILELELLTALDSSVNRPGDEIQARTLSPLYVMGELALPAGAYVEGRITEVEASGRVKGRSRLAFTFDRLRTPKRLEKIRTSFVEQESESGKKKDAAVIGGAAGVGAVVGGIIGGKKGAAIGGAIGGAGGTGVVLTTKGEEIRLPVGTAVNVRLDEPFVIQQN